MLSWILWMDQTVYTQSGPANGGGGEGGSSGWQQLAVVPTKAACEALKRERVADAARKDATATDTRRRYPDRFRFFCSPAEEDATRK
jgi:hypothetical protein